MALRAKRVRVSHAYEEVAKELEAQILDGTLRPGDRLPGEVEMAGMFGVNRSTVREGIRRLESEGFVRRVSPRRMEVSLPRAKELTSRHARALTIMQVSFEELWRVALATEPLAAELAALEARPEDLAALDANQAALEQALENGTSPVDIDTAFHALVSRIGRNRVLELAREPVGFLLYAGMERLTPLLPGAPARQVEAHRRIIAAIRAGDAAEAGAWMRRHIEDFRRGYVLADLPLDAPMAGPGIRPARP